MKLIGALCVASTLVAGSTVAQAKSQSDEPVIVRANPDDSPPTRKVSFADLNLASQSGQKSLFRRVRVAVTDVCDESTHDSYGSPIHSMCRDIAWDGARPQIRRAISRAEQLAANGYSTIAPVAIAIASAR